MKKGARKKYFVFGNLFYILKQIHAWDKWSVPGLILNTPIALVLSLATTAFAPAIYYMIEEEKGIGAIFATATFFMVVMIISNILSSFFSKLSSAKQMQNQEKFNISIVDKLMDLDFELLEGPIGRLNYQKAKNALSYKGVYSFLNAFFDFITALLGFSSYSLIISQLSPWIVIIILVAQLLGMSTMLIGSLLVNKLKHQRADVDRRINYIIKNSRDFQIAKDIRIYSMSESLLYLGRMIIQRKEKLERKVDRFYRITDLISVLVSILIKGGVYVYLIYTIITTDSFSGAEITLYLTSMLGFGSWVEKVAKSIGNFFDCNLQVSNMREFMDMENTMLTSGGVDIPTEEPFEIEVEHLSFVYPGSDKKVLDDVSFKIGSGEHIALVGVNGAGKTTLVKLICGLYRPTEGRILLNGIDISKFNRDEYYKKISVVFQDARVLPVSLLENISQLPKDKTDDDLLQNCLTLSGFDKKVETLEDGIDTLLVKDINKNGIELSGGEMQKLLLARALYKKASVLILDEPTAALDPIAENEVYLKYNELSQNKTTLYISHRLSSTRFCDRIIFFDNAKIAEEGTHDELMSLHGKYAEMFEIQSRYYNEEVNINE